MKKILLSTMLIFTLSVPVMAQTTWGSSSSSSTATTGDCSSAVQQQVADYQRSSIDDERVLASQMFTSLPSNTDYGQLSCLNSILNTGISGLLNGGNSLSSILSNVVNSVCSMGTSMLQQAVEPLSQTVNSAIPTGDIVPGLSLGSLSGGISINPHIGGNGSNIGTSGSYLGFSGTEIPSYNLNTLTEAQQIPSEVFPSSWQTGGTYSSGLTGSGSWW